MSRTKPRGDIVGWEVKVKYGSFTVELVYQNMVRRSYTYQFNDEDGVFKGLAKFAKHRAPREILQEVFDALVHEEIMSQLLAEARYKKTGKIDSPYDGSRFASVQRMAEGSPLEG